MAGYSGGGVRVLVMMIVIAVVILNNRGSVEYDALSEEGVLRRDKSALRLIHADDAIKTYYRRSTLGLQLQ
jgi:hypothetical protein